MKSTVTQLVAKIKVLEDEIRTKSTKHLENQTHADVKSLEIQLAQANTKMKTMEEDIKVKSKSWERQVTDLKTAKSNLQSNKDREGNTFRARIKTLENAVADAAKTIAAYEQDAENAKMRKVDQSWQHGGFYPGSYA